MKAPLPAAVLPLGRVPAANRRRLAVVLGPRAARRLTLHPVLTEVGNDHCPADTEGQDGALGEGPGTPPGPAGDRLRAAVDAAPSRAASGVDAAAVRAGGASAAVGLGTRADRGDR